MPLSALRLPAVGSNFTEHFMMHIIPVLLAPSHYIHLAEIFENVASYYRIKERETARANGTRLTLEIISACYVFHIGLRMMRGRGLKTVTLMVDKCTQLSNNKNADDNLQFSGFSMT